MTKQASLDTLKKLYSRHKVPIQAAAALGILSSVLGYQTRHDTDKKHLHDIDLDVPNPESLARVRQQYMEQHNLLPEGKKEKEDEKNDSGIKTKAASTTKSAADPSSAVSGAAMVLGPILGFTGGRALGNLMKRGPEDELEEAKEKYRKALMREQLAALKAGRGGGDVQKFLPKQASSEYDPGSEGFFSTLLSPLKPLWNPYTGYAAPAALLSGIVASKYFADQSDERKKYQQAKNLVERRLNVTAPRARLYDLEDDEEEKQKALELLRENDLI